MDNPSISVILPAYNCERFIERSVKSVLEQSFTDFELIIIDDGSTDNTAAVIGKFNDPRIRFLQNEKNSGLVFTLNRGIDASTGKYIARMDGDDISLPFRFATQFSYLENNPATDMISSVADLISEDDQPLGEWSDDRNHLTARAIRNFLPKDNCIVHPAVLIRTALLKQYRFRREQSQAEDYDLWLRLAADGVKIEKINEPLLKHRILNQSFTRKRQTNVFWKNARTKINFSRHALASGKFNFFVFKTLGFGLADLLLGTGKKIKSIIIP
ncbi:MAG: glycosyltransferase [Chitinophagaceae bacterium]